MKILRFIGMIIIDILAIPVSVVVGLSCMIEHWRDVHNAVWYWVQTGEQC